MAQEKKATKSVADDFSAVTFSFSTGETLEAKVSDFPDSIQDALTCHGLAQKLGDSYAGADAAHAYSAANAVFEAMKEGNWTQRTGGTSGPRISQLAEALSQVTGQEVEACVAKLATLDEEVKKQIRAQPQIKTALAEIKVRKAQEAAAKAAEEAGEAAEEGTLDLTSLVA